jgi:hypothetical protein
MPGDLKNAHDVYASADPFVDGRGIGVLCFVRSEQG